MDFKFLGLSGKQIAGVALVSLVVGMIAGRMGGAGK